MGFRTGVRTVDGRSGAVDLTATYEPLLGRAVEILAVGEATMHRRDMVANSITLQASGAMKLSYFTATKTEAITQLRTSTGSTAGTLITLARQGVYSVAANGDLALLAAWANDATAFTAGNTEYQRTLTSIFNKVARTRYAIGTLVVNTGTMPTFMGGPGTAGPTGSFLNRAPRLAGVVTGLADLPNNVANAAVVAPTAMGDIYTELVP